jgi:phosphopantetheine--protein transferase-like protein
VGYTEEKAINAISRSTVRHNCPPLSPVSDNYCPNRWAAKEAIYKAMYPYRKLSWKDVELKPLQIQISDHSGDATPKLEIVFTKPMNVTVKDSTLSFMQSHLSISHDAGLVIAMVVLEGQ